MWRTLGRVGLIKSRSAVSGVDPDDFADFLLDFSGGPDPCLDLFSLIPEQGEFNANVYYFRNIVLGDVVKESFRCSGYRCVKANGVHIKPIIDGLDMLLPQMLDLSMLLSLHVSTPRSGSAA